MAMLTETARRTAVAPTTAETESGALSWFASMCAAFGLLGLTLVRDRLVLWIRPSRPSRPPAAPTPRRRASGGPASLPYVTRCAQPPAR